MSLQPSASRTALLLECPRPFDPELDVEPELPGEPARYGSAFHQVLAACLRTVTRGSKPVLLEKQPSFAKEVDRAAKTYDVRSTAAELAGHVRSSAGYLRAWLKREQLEVEEVETAYAVGPKRGGTWSARAIAAHDEDHRYDVEADELPGTVDLIARSADRRRAVVLDHKTGAYATENFATPSKMPQMRTLGLVVLKGNAEVGVAHFDRLGLPMIYAEPYEVADQRMHASALWEALSLVGRGYLRAGAHCSRCPMRDTCPAHAAEIISSASEALARSANAMLAEPITGALVPAKGAELAVEARAGLLYDLLKKIRSFEKAGSAEIKRLVREGKVVETREGKVLAIQTQKFETLSMKSIREALGKVDGEKMIEKLRKMGAVRESTRDVLVGEK